MCSVAKRIIVMLMRNVRLAVKFKKFSFRKPHLGYLTLKTVALTLTNHKLQIPLLTLIQTCNACSASPSLCTNVKEGKVTSVDWRGKPAGEPETTHFAHATTTTVTVTRQQQLLQLRLTSIRPRPADKEWCVGSTA